MVVEFNAVDTKVQILVDKSLKHDMTQTNKDLRKRINMFTKRCLLLTVGQKTYHNTKISKIKNKIRSVTGLIITADLNTKTTEIENNVSDITNLATKAALDTNSTEIENKIPDITDFITTHEGNRSTKINFDARMKQEES